MILGIGLNTVVTRRVGNMLPALVIGAILAYVVFPS